MKQPESENITSFKGNVISISTENGHKNATMSKKNLSDNQTPLSAPTGSC